DLIPAAISLVPGLVGLRRGLARLLGRPIAQSGSGPTLWALYPSLAEASTAAESVRAAARAGGLAIPGDRPPTILATTILPTGADADPPRGERSAVRSAAMKEDT